MPGTRPMTNGPRKTPASMGTTPPGTRPTMSGPTDGTFPRRNTRTGNPSPPSPPMAGASRRPSLFIEEIILSNLFESSRETRVRVVIWVPSPPPLSDRLSSPGLSNFLKYSQKTLKNIQATKRPPPHDPSSQITPYAIKNFGPPKEPKRFI